MLRSDDAKEYQGDAKPWCDDEPWNELLTYLKKNHLQEYRPTNNFKSENYKWDQHDLFVLKYVF